MWTKTLAAGLVATLAVAAAPIGASAGAAEVSTLSETQLKESSLRIRDVPDSLFQIKKKRDFHYAEGRDAVAPDLCVKSDGSTRYGKRPRSYASSQIGLADEMSEFTFTETNSDIYQYRNTKQAARAYAGIKRISKKCLGKIKYSFDEGGASGSILIKGVKRDQDVFNGVAGFSLAFDLDAKIDITNIIDASFLADQYAEYYLSGKSIVRVEYADVSVHNKNAITSAIRDYVKDASLTVADRVWERATAGLG